jgi:hypothetical protein
MDGAVRIELSIISPGRIYFLDEFFLLLCGLLLLCEAKKGKQQPVLQARIRLRKIINIFS